MRDETGDMPRLDKLAPPPRHVPITLRLSNILGGFAHQFGWCFFSFGMIFVLVFGLHGGALESFRQQLKFTGATEFTKGTVVAAEETNATVNDQEVVRYIFEFKVGDEELGGQCFVTGWSFDEGDQVDIEYAVDDPLAAKIKGSRWAPFPPWVVLLVAIFPGIGLAFIVYSIKGNLAAANLLAKGRVAYGTLVSCEPTNTQVNEQTVFKYTFKFKAESTGREHLAIAKTHEGEAIEDEDEEPILYLPSNPEYAALFDNLPGTATLDERGQLQGASIIGTAFKLVLPLIGTLETLYLVQRLFVVFSG